MDELTQLFERVEQIAAREHDGHYTLFRFTTGYKGAFGTPNLDNAGAGRRQVRMLPSFKTLPELLRWMLDERLDYRAGGIDPPA